jgi:hypothetical protein
MKKIEDSARRNLRISVKLLSQFFQNWLFALLGNKTWLGVTIPFEPQIGVKQFLITKRLIDFSCGLLKSK